jgi:hypothetical protein
MIRYLLLVWILLLGCLSLNAVQAAHEAEIIALAISTEIQTGQPVFLELNCGEWTPSLSQHLISQLLARNEDVRVDFSGPDAELAESDSGSSRIKPSDYGLATALLVQVNLNLKWQEKVSRNFFSYRSVRQPVYSFEIRQIMLPEQKIIKISNYDFSRPNADEQETPQLRMRWFEPLVAGAAIASMIFLLWNFN